MTVYSLATHRMDNSATPVLGIKGRFWRLADVAFELIKANPSRGLMNVFDHWKAAEPVLNDLAEKLEAGSFSDKSFSTPANPDDILTPLQYPAKVICTGANYYDHIQNDGGHTSFNKAANIPVFFLKPPTTTLVGCGRSVAYPVQTKKFDYEVEFAVVIGRKARRLKLENALECVAGYTIAIDLSARDWQRHPQHLVKFDLFGGKAFDASCPVGPGIVPAHFVDPANTPLKLSVNGESRQDSNTKHMIWSVAEQLVSITEHVTLEPGDIIATGTPAGVGLKTQNWLKVGDKIDAELGVLGRLSVEIVPAEQS